MAAAAQEPINTGAFPSFLGTAPILFSSTHGVYDIDEPLTFFYVPANTIIIETGDISESCYFIEWYRAVVPLLQNRRKLVSYLRGIPDPVDSMEQQKIYISAIRHIRFYEPGAKIYNRTLLLYGGRNIRENGKHISIRRVYELMKFSRINLDGSEKELLKKRNRELHEEGASDTYENIVKLFFEATPDLTERIIIFSCCGSIRITDKTVPKATIDRRIALVQEAQEGARLIFMSKREEPVLEPPNHVGRHTGRLPPIQFHPNARMEPDPNDPYTYHGSENTIERLVNRRPAGSSGCSDGTVALFSKESDGSRKQVVVGRDEKMCFTMAEIYKMLRGKNLDHYLLYENGNFNEIPIPAPVAPLIVGKLAKGGKRRTRKSSRRKRI